MQPFFHNCVLSLLMIFIDPNPASEIYLSPSTASSAVAKGKRAPVGIEQFAVCFKCASKETVWALKGTFKLQSSS